MPFRLRDQLTKPAACLLLLAAALVHASAPGIADDRRSWLTPTRINISEGDVAAADAPPDQLHDGWKTSSLSAQKIAPRPLAELRARIQAGEYVGIDGIVVARNAHLVYEAYFGDFDKHTQHQTRSTFKSVTGLLAGIAVGDGLLGLDDRVAPLIARYYEPYDSDSRKRRIAVRDLLQMQSGLDCSEMPGTGPYRESVSNRSSDKVAADFGLPMSDEPGAIWRYCSANTFLLGVALESALAREKAGSLKSFLDNRLLRLLGIWHYHIGRTPKGHLPMHGGERMTPRDLAKFGQLLLSRGRWNDRQVVPMQWISEILAPGVETGWSWTSSIGPDSHLRRTSRYRFKWFQTPLRVQERDYELIHSWGNGGQFIVAVPSLDLVVVVTGSNYGSRKIGAQKQTFHMLYTSILPAAINGGQ